MSFKPTNKQLFVLVIFLAVAVRVAAVWLGQASLTEDPDSYARLAVNLSDTGVYGFKIPDYDETSSNRYGAVRPTAYRPPLYPWLLSWFVEYDGRLALEQVAILHCLLGIATVALTYSIALQLGLVAWIPALAVACDPLLIRASQLIMTETLAAFLVVLIWRVWLFLCPSEQNSLDQFSHGRNRRQNWILALGLGILLGLAILARPTAAPWAILCIIGFAAISPGKEATHDFKNRVLKSGLVGFGVLMCVAPWMARNYSILGRPIWATTHGGYTLMLANNPLLFQHFRDHGPSRGWDAEPFHRAWASRTTNSLSPTTKEFWFIDNPSTGFQQLDELDDNRLAYESAVSTIRRDKSTFVVASFYRIGWLWAIWPYANAISLTLVSIGGWYAFWYLFTVRRIVRGVWSHLFLPWLPGLALVVSLTAIHAVYWSNMRMRGPMMCVVYLAATSVRNKEQLE